MALEQCSHCRNALEVIRLRSETEEVEPLSRECALVVANYLASIIDNKACRCLLKNANYYVALLQIIIDLIELNSSLIATLNEDLLCFIDLESGSFDTSGMKSSSSPDSMIENENESMDLDASCNSLIRASSGEVRGFTFDDRREIFHILPLLLSEQYTFYILYNRYHSANPDVGLSADKEAYAGNHFDVLGFPAPYVLVLAAVRETGLLDRIQQCFYEAKPGLMPPQFALKFIQALNAVRRLANEQTILNHIFPARESAQKFLCDLIDEQGEMLRDPYVKSCAEQLWISSRDCLEDTYSVDVFGLALIVKHLGSPYLAPRLTGLAQLNTLINVCSEMLNSEHAASSEIAANSIANYLCEHKVLQLLFGPNSHAEVLKQCPNLLNFMALYGKISKEDLDCIWSAAQMKHCGRQVFDLLGLIIKGLDPQLILHLYGLLKALKPNEHTEMTLHLASFVTKMIWSYALCRGSFIGIPHHQILPRLSSSSVEHGHTFAAIYSGRDLQLSPEKVGGSNLNSRMDLSGDSTQASTTGDVGADDRSCEDMIEVEDDLTPSKDRGQVEPKNSPPPLIESGDDGKGLGKRAQAKEDVGETEDRRLFYPEPRQKRARVVLEPASPREGARMIPVKANQDTGRPLKVKVEGITGEEHCSPAISSTTSATESSESGEVDENALVGQDGEQDGSSATSDDRSSEADQEQVKRLLQHAKYGSYNERFPHVPKALVQAVAGNLALSQPRAIPGVSEHVSRDFLKNYAWIHTAESTSGLLERLVKQKELTNSRDYNGSDSDISSDGGSSSDRLNDLEDDEELAAANGEVVFDSNELELIGKRLQGYPQRPTHSSTYVLDEDDDDGVIGPAPFNQAVIIDRASHHSPPHSDGEPVTFKSSRAANVHLQLIRQTATQHQMAAAAAALQLQQQSRNIFAQLAPHAKMFWQEKYAQLSESDKALFDLNLVCEPGHTLLWDLVVDGSAPLLPAVINSSELEPHIEQHQIDHLPSELQIYALQMLEEVVAWAPNIFIKKYFVRGCVERLRNHKSVPIVLQVIRKILASFRQTWRTPAAAIAAHHYAHRSGSDENNAVIWADGELNLLSAFFDDLQYFRQHQSKFIDGGMSIEQELRARMEFLEYVFSNQGTPTGFQMIVEQLDILWDCLSLDAYGRELLHKWLLDQLKSQTQHALNTELLNHILMNKVVNFKGETLTSAGLAFLQAVLQDSTSNSPQGNGDFIVQVCLPLIWSAALRNADTTVAMAAMTFISNYYVHAGGSAQKEIEFIDSCMSHLRYACEAMGDNELPATLICIQRAIVILRSHIDAFRRRHAFHLRSLELEGRGVKSHMHCVPHASLVDFIPTISITLQAPGIEKKAILEISSTDLLGHLRAEVMHWWKNAKRSSNIALPSIRGGDAKRTSSAPMFSFDFINSRPATKIEDIPVRTISPPSSLPFNVVRPVGVTVPINVAMQTASESGNGAFIPVVPSSQKTVIQQEDSAFDQTAQSGPSNPILSDLLSSGNGQVHPNDGPLRLLCGGRELTADLDEKTLSEIGLRESAIIHVQAGSNGSSKSCHQHGILAHGISGYSPGQISVVKEKPQVATAPPDPTSMPMALLSTPNNFQLLMDLIKLLIDKSRTVEPDLALKCQTWSYRAWEVIQLLPTYAPFVESFLRVLDENPNEESADGELGTRWASFFDSTHLHYFLYAMQCLEMFTQKRDQFAGSGGMKHLINVFMSRSLFPKPNGDWSEWEIECLTSILRVVHNFSIETDDTNSTFHGEAGSSSQSGFRILHGRSTKIPSLDMLVSTLNMTKFATVDVSNLVATILDLIAIFCSKRPSSQVHSLISHLHGLQYAFQLLICLLASDDGLRKEFRFGTGSNLSWLKLILLDCHDPYLRREISASLYRLCRGRTKKGYNGRLLTSRLISCLLSLLKDANDLSPFVNDANDGVAFNDIEEKAQKRTTWSSMGANLFGNTTIALITPNNISDQKEPYGPSPSSYFWLLTNLLESLLRGTGDYSSTHSASLSADKDVSVEKELADAEFSVNLDEIAAEIAKYLLERRFYESKFAFKGKQLEYGSMERRMDREHNYQFTDAGLVGLLQTAIAIAKFNPSWKYSTDGETFLHSVFDLLFALPVSKNNRYHPKCQSSHSRIAAYDLLVELAKGHDANYAILFKKLMEQNSKASHDGCYGWEYWPQDERRAPCGYVGLMNLGATCYMASAMQQLYMTPRLRAALLNARVVESTNHEPAFREMQKMFAFLLESERKAYNPRAFCKAYQMNHQPLNITEQKDMAEFFIDLITKLEEMNPDLKRVVKTLFCGTMSNNVVSLDCPHVSKTMEDFYTVRCQVADMKDLHESLSELTVGDMLEGDNMYTCSQCNKKVRAEKRACFQKLPRILCFNTMRYTFNMITMMKEKVNTHFSFPFRLNMAPFMEENLLPSHASGDETNDSTLWYSKMNVPSNEYELIGVTVHTGTADGGHYYSFIRERNTSSDSNQPCDPESDRWYSFNDADVRPWDPAQLAAECFGGELTRQQYDTVAEKYLDLSFEKTNSAYMLFYERVPTSPKPSRSPVSKLSGDLVPAKTAHKPSAPNKSGQIKLPEDVERWICEDNLRFIQDLMFFDHAYFNFVWQVCSQVPATLLERDAADITFMSAKLSLSFVLETLLHSKEKAMISQWLEIILKDLSASHRACEWFLNRMAKNGDWPTEILIGCPSKSCREIFQKLCLHAIFEVHLKHEQLYLLPWTDGHRYDDFDVDDIGNQSCVGKFIKRLLLLAVTQYANVEIRQMNEYFGLLLDFAKSLPAAIRFLHLVSAIYYVCNFYVKRSKQEATEIESEEDLSEEELGGGVVSMVKTGVRISSLWSQSVMERLLKLVTLLIENGYGPDGNLILRQKDIQMVLGGKSYPFLMQMIKDVGNPSVSGPLILSVCQGNAALGKRIIETIFDCLKRMKDDTDQYLNLLSYFVEIAEKSVAVGTASSTNYAMVYVNMILERMWELADVKAGFALKWLGANVTNHRSIVFDALISSMKTWVEKFLLKSAHHPVRLAAGELLLSLIPSPGIRSFFATVGKGISLSPRAAISSEAVVVMHRVYEHLLWLLRNRAADYALDQHHSTHRLVAFFQTMKACLVSKDEKLMLVPYAADIWNLFHKCMEKPVKINANKQALLTFWYMACVDCPELIQACVKVPGVHQYFMYNYVHIADDDDELTNHNKVSLHAFYGLMRLFCLHSPAFCEVVIRHENMTFACQSVATKEAYKDAREEIFGAIEICCKQPTVNKRLLAEFKQQIWSLFLGVAARSRANFPVLLRFLKFACDTPHDKVILLHYHVLPICSEAFETLHKMHHEASGCNVLADLLEMLKRFQDILKLCTRCSSNSSALPSATVPPKLGSPTSSQNTAATAQAAQTMDEAIEDEAREIVAKAVHDWSNMDNVLHRLLELLNSFIPPEIRKLSIDCIKEITVLSEGESLRVILPEIKRVHAQWRTANTIATSVGPYFPKRGQTTANLSSFRRIQPPRAMFNMCLQPTQLEASKGVDTTYDQMLMDYFQPYHNMVDRLLRTAFNLGPDVMPPALLAEISCLVGHEGVPLHFAFFPKLWLDLHQRLRDGKDVQKEIDCLCRCVLLRDYIDAILVQEQPSLSNSQIFNFVQLFMDKCQHPIPVERLTIAIDNAICYVTDVTNSVEVILRAINPTVMTVAPTSIYLELERLPMALSRARGAFRAIFLAYVPNKLPPELFDGDLRRRLIEMWTAFISNCRDKLADITTMPVDNEEQQDAVTVTEVSSIHIRKEIESKLSQYCHEFLEDNKDIVGILLSRLEIPEPPVEENEDDARKNEIEMKEMNEN